MNRYITPNTETRGSTAATNNKANSYFCLSPLIKVSDAVNLPINGVQAHPQAVGICLKQRVTGIAIDGIVDVTYIYSSELPCILILIRIAISRMAWLTKTG